MQAEDTLNCTVPDEIAGQRLDKALAQLFPAYSRARLQNWVREGHVLVDGTKWRTRDAVQGGEQIIISPQHAEPLIYEPEVIPLEVAFEDEHLLVINKPSGLVVHPAAGNWHGTLLNALLSHAPALRRLPRAGIVHRLDKDTTGLMVVAKSEESHHSLVKQLQARDIHREYLTVVKDKLVAGGSVETPIGRHPVDRKRMAVILNGKPAVTHYRVEQRYRAHTLLRVTLETGRTHQIRVHMAHIRHPVLGDPVYGGRQQLPRGASQSLIVIIQGFRRQALHACGLGLTHPASGDSMQWRADLPADMQMLVNALKLDLDDHNGHS